MPFDHIFTSTAQYAVVAVVLALAEAVYVMFGFGMGLIAVGALAMIIADVQHIVVLVMLVNVPAELYVVLTNRDKIAWRGVALICAGILVGVLLGTWILKHSEPTFLLTVLGGFLIAAGAGFLLSAERRQIDWPPWVGPIAGTAAGVLGGLFSTGGPPLILYYQLSKVDKAVFRGSLLTIFLVLGCVRLPAYAVLGLLTPARLWSALLVLPPVLMGAYLGHRAQLKLSEEQFRRLVSLALIAIGVVLLFRRLTAA